MNSPTTAETAAEIATILDSLAALSQDLSCQSKGPRDTLVLSAGKTQDACAAIDNAVESLKAILAMAVEAGGGPAPASIVERLDDATGA